MTAAPARRPAPVSAPKLRAKLVTTRSSQLVRLPKQFRMPGSEVLVSRDGDRIVLEPIEVRGWPKGYFESFGPVGDDFLSAGSAARR